MDGPRNYVRWTIKDAAKLLLGDIQHLNNYRDAWVSYHKDRIKEIANQFYLPEFLLGRIA